MSHGLLVATCMATLLAWISPMASAATEGYLDTFDDGGYDGNYGTLSFSAPWSEFGDDGRHQSGKVYVNNSGCSEGCLHLDGPGAVVEQFGVSRSVDLSVFQSVTLSFDLEIEPGTLDTAELWVEVYDGASWRVVATYSLSQDVDRGVSFDVTAHAAANSAVRFRVPGPLGGTPLGLTYAGTTEIDDVTLSGTLTPTTTTTTEPPTTTTTLAATTTSSAGSATTTSGAGSAPTTSGAGSGPATTSAGPTGSTDAEAGEGLGAAPSTTTTVPGTRGVLSLVW